MALSSSRRFFQASEEMLILTQSDELNRTHSEEARLPFDLASTSIDDIAGTGQVVEQASGSSGAPQWDNPALKETKAAIVPSGSGTIAVAAVATADSRWFDKSRRFGRGRRSSERKQRKSYRPGRRLGNNMPTQKLLEAEGEGAERRKGIIPLNPVRNSSSITERLNPAATITAWEAAWNITNAIQVPNVTPKKEKKLKTQIKTTRAFGG